LWEDRCHHCARGVGRWTCERRGCVRVHRAGERRESSEPITVHKDESAPWDPSIYNQEIPDNGYTYLTTRDGTKLAIDVHPPTSPAGEPGVPSEFHMPTLPIPGVPPVSYTAPYPTLIEYSGYGYANPAGPENGIAVLANLMGFAVVDVNMRGTGCSGGAYDFFESLQNLDGYDVIETIAHQPWVLGNKVGMLGISYGAISQLFTAQTQPAGLEAIEPLSTIDATASTLYPGGVLNTGFAVAWAEQRQQNAEPASPGHGQAWATKRIEEGDQICAANQELHGEATNLMEKIKANATYNPPVADPLDPVTFVKNINVPISWPVSGRTSRPADTAPIWRSTSPERAASGSRSQTAPTSTRSIRTRLIGCMTFSSCTSRIRRRSSTRR
jgi:hypothetical protein